MKRWWMAGLGLCWALACANPMAEPEPEPVPEPIREQVQRVQVQVAGERRNALLHVPDGAPEGSLPLVVVLHGGVGGDARRMVPFFEGRFDDGVMFLFPSGREAPSADKDKDKDEDEDEERTHAWKASDVEVLRKLVSRVRDKHDVDSSRIFVVGHGTGGAVAYHAGCMAADLFDGVGVVSQTMPRELAGRCKPDKPLPFVLIAGTEDERVLWTGRDAMLGVMESAERWMEIDGCDPKSATEEVLEDLDVDDGVRVKQHDWTCTEAPVRVYELAGGGHAWPGSEGKGGKAKKGKGRTAQDVDGADVLLEFFLEE